MQGPRGAATDRRLFIVGLAWWLLIGLSGWLLAAPLGHDEAQYALAGQQALAGQPPTWLYLSYGMNSVAMPGLWLGGSERALRFAPWLLGLAFALIATRLARRVAGPTVAGCLVLLLAATHAIALRAAALLSDLPSCACLLLATTILVEELGSGAPTPGAPGGRGPRWRLLGAAPALAAAFYLRYGSCLVIAAIVAVALLLGWPAMRRRPAPVVATAAAALALLLPHALQSWRATGSVFGVLLQSSEAVAHPVLGGLPTYLFANPLSYYGVAAAPVMIAGLLSAFALRDRRELMLWLFAVSSFVALGLTTQAQSRYVIYPLTLLLLLGAQQLLRWRARLTARRRLVDQLAGALVAVSCLVSLAVALGAEGTRRRAIAPTLAAAAALGHDAAGAACVVLGRRTTQLQWYSGCRAVMAIDPAAAGARKIYVVYDARTRWQPRLLGPAGPELLVLDDPPVRVVRLVAPTSPPASPPAPPPTSPPASPPAPPPTR